MKETYKKPLAFGSGQTSGAFPAAVIAALSAGVIAGKALKATLDGKTISRALDPLQYCSPAEAVI